MSSSNAPSTAPPPSICIVSGVGNAGGTGAAAAKQFAKQLGYRVALIARRLKDLQVIEKEIVDNGGEAHSFPVEDYNWPNIVKVFGEIKEHWPDSRVEVAIWNTAQWSMIPFLDVKESDIEKSTRINIISAFAFAQESIKLMLSPSPSSGSSSTHKTGGTIIFTGATSGTRGAANFATFAAGKHGLRALSQSIGREFGKRGIHSAYVVVDGAILTPKIQEMFGGRAKLNSTPGKKEGEEDGGENWLDDPGRRIDPTSIAKNMVWLHLQEQDCWTLELDLRPAKEHF